ncbi:MAG: 4-hydroxy-3-methylbut-2-enyl diphosphate reductase [Verrucomicrobiota bacterium]|jgi:4-hydroxy-3-methylbut-2-enyl diphosphate reductase|nr:4-hydroxy-3-methylbut-2-enyl diphosphate reductase [Verrucomicrobiota bacterium]MDP7049555.1 4-hydroxy-3-methylbut-2-enyl diphosphate reductase [Verrucomicrobiota bacterium]
MPSAEKPKRINVRRPDIMEKVKAEVVTHYRSELVEHIRANNCKFAYGNTDIRLAKEFGFCYGVERAIDLAYAARQHFPSEQPVYILGEIIHNPHVNEQIRDMGLTFLSGDHQAANIDDLQEGDPVVVPAFGTEVKITEQLNQQGCTVIDATCGDVMSVWKRVRQNALEQVTSIIHGKAWHEETKATSSQAKAYENGHYLVVFDLDETDTVCRYIARGGDREVFLKQFGDATSDGFNPDKHLDSIGLANQTTMLRGETEEVQRRLKAAMIEKHGEDALEEHFRFFDTICGATQDRQDALRDLLSRPMDLLLVVGGYNSSNTSHLAEMGEAKLPSYFIKDASEMESIERLHHFLQCKQEMAIAENWLPSGGELTVGITAGASCPNNLIEEVILRVYTLRGIPANEVLGSVRAETTAALA